ncbi:MAG: rod shape-determining protein MreD [Candidatus Marinimicrobia bacterium]|nr:rod shape-determining protein MreD [Candidatus Neomarinimicrobiota bacterium]
MNWRHPAIGAFAVFLLQFVLSEYLTIQRIRPDFLLIFVIYLALKNGSMQGVIYGFTLGIIEDFLSAGSLIGLAPLTKSITGFLIGRLQGKFHRMNPFVFHIAWVAVGLLHFVVYVYVRYQSVYESSQPLFWGTWILVAGYTFVFIGIMQIIVPFHRVHPNDKLA